MLVNSFLYILLFCVVSILLCMIGVIVTYFMQGQAMAQELFNSWVFYFNGILVGGFGYGLVWFLKKYSISILAQIKKLIEIPPEAEGKILYFSRASSSWIWKNIFGIPITVIGGVVLWSCNYPLSGFAKFYLAICSISIYYVGAYIFSSYIFLVLLFKSLEDCQNRASLNEDVISLEFDNLNNFFVISSTLGVMGLYVGFRGTLTANFDLISGSVLTKKLLIFPLALFLPMALCYSFYPRYVLRRIYENDILRKLKTLDSKKDALLLEQMTLKEKLEIDKLISEIREKLLHERKQFPLVGLKDSPSLLLTILMAIQFISQYDEVVSKFFKSLF